MNGLHWIDFATILQRDTSCACRKLSSLVFDTVKSFTYLLQMFGLTDIIKQIKEQGPVVQSIVSLTTSLRVISLTVSADPIYSILIFFAEKMWVAFALQKLLTFFHQKISAYLRITRCKF